jgi:cation:H+ antiporter
MAGGLVALVIGAELLVRGASRLAAAVGLSPLVIGLTVVAYGTSSPELAVSVGAAWSGQADVALGNVVGSNTFNVLFILGASALIVPLAVHWRFVRTEVPIMIAVSLLVQAMAADGRIGRLDGLVLLAGMVGYTVLTVRSASDDPVVQAEAAAEVTVGRGRVAIDGALVLGGLVLLGGGARAFVDAAIAIARTLGMTELVIGLTIVAAGTSLPEVATSLLAAWRGQRDIAVGNVVGSNVFNLLGVLGAAAVIGPDGVAVPPAAASFDLPVMVAVAFACLPIFFTGGEIARWEGALLLAYYVAYTTWLVLHGSEHAATAVYATVMLRFVLPLTAVTLAVLGVRAWAGARRAG